MSAFRAAFSATWLRASSGVFPVTTAPDEDAAIQCRPPVVARGEV
jgi:hypothetical protein